MYIRRIERHLSDSLSANTRKGRNLFRVKKNVRNQKITVFEIMRLIRNYPIIQFRDLQLTKKYRPPGGSPKIHPKVPWYLSWAFTMEKDCKQNKSRSEKVLKSKATLNDRFSHIFLPRVISSLRGKIVGYEIAYSSSLTALPWFCCFLIQL